MAASMLRAAHARLLRAIPEKIKFPFQKLKGGRLEKIGLYWRGILIDYREVTKDGMKDARDRPRKTAIIFAGLGVLIAAFNTNPNEYELTNQLLTNSNRLLLVPESIRNRDTEDHIRRLHRASLEGVLRVTNFSFFSLLWIADHDGGSGLYAAQCTYLKPRYLTFFQRVIDVGAFGRWFNLERKMKDYDVSIDEWTVNSKPES